MLSLYFFEDRAALPPRNLEAVSKLSLDLGIHLQTQLIVRNNSSLARALVEQAWCSTHNRVSTRNVCNLAAKFNNEIENLPIPFESAEELEPLKVFVGRVLQTRPLR